MTRALFLALLLITGASGPAQQIITLPGTDPLTWNDDISVRLMDGAHRYIERKIEESPQDRQRFWRRDFSSRAAYEKSVDANRQRFSKYIGVADERVQPLMERFGYDDGRGLAAETRDYRVYRVRWSVLDGVSGEGLLLEPAGRPLASVIAVPDADQTPEQISGLAGGVPREAQFARHLARAGFQVIVPVLIDRASTWSGHPRFWMTNQPHREWLYRQSFMMGRHIIGYEVQKILSVVDWVRQSRPGAKVGIAGYGEGGLLAFYSAAVDTRIEAALVSGYFKPRQKTWQEPLYRNVWALLQEFGDAEIASLIAPRGLVVEYSTEPPVDGPPPAREGQRNVAAPGRLETPSFDSVSSEFNRIDELVPPGFQARSLIHGAANRPTGPGSQQALQQFAQLLEATATIPSLGEEARDQDYSFDAAGRQRRQVKELEEQVQRLVRHSDHVRNDFFLYKVFPEFERPPWSTDYRIDTRSFDPLVQAGKQYKEYLWEEVLGKLPDPLLPSRPRSRLIYDEPKWRGYEVVLEVFPDLIAWGILCVPKDIQPGERRPVVVCQHGRNGLPENVVAGDHRAYHNFAGRLAERGFVTFAPHNLYRVEERYRLLDRKANLVKASLFSFILAQHQQILNWLERLPFVDPERMAFYGLSYGGETAVRIPPLLERYRLAICSGDFNDWTRKVASTHDRYSFMFTDEWEMPYFDLGSKFSYAELAYLMIPRPFMVERGHHDAVAPDQWVASEFAKARWLYTQFELEDKIEIEFFNGGHTINAQGTFDFLHKHLNWPKP